MNDPEGKKTTIHRYLVLSGQMIFFMSKKKLINLYWGLYYKTFYSRN